MTLEELAAQNSQMLAELDRLWFVLVVLVFVQVFGLFMMFGLSAWSISKVVSHNDRLEHEMVETMGVMAASYRGMQRREVQNAAVQ